jgi:hypothetical protein
MMRIASLLLTVVFSAIYVGLAGADTRQDNTNAAPTIEKAYSTATAIQGQNARIKAPADPEERLFVVDLQIPAHAGERLKLETKAFVAECGPRRVEAIAVGTPVAGDRVVWTNSSMEITAQSAGSTSVSVVFELSSATTHFQLHFGDAVLEVEPERHEATAVAPARAVPDKPGRKEIARDGAFVAFDDGTVLDTRSALMWAAQDNGAGITWTAAKTYCEAYRAGGYSDWRMPTSSEMAQLYDETKKGYPQKCGGEILRLTPLVQLSCGLVWVSEVEGPGSAWFFVLWNGSRKWNDKDFAPPYRALPVRVDRPDVPRSPTR